MTIVYIILKVLFWLCFFAVLHTYVLYPLIVRTLAAGRPQNKLQFSREELPGLSILIAAYNEEEVIGEKLDSIFKSSYPADKIEVLVGSDNSTDRTNEIVAEFSRRFSGVRLVPFTERTGKVRIINELEKQASHPVLILTDANVIFDSETLYELVKHFGNAEVALVDTNMINMGLKKGGISIQEKTYIQSEVHVKYAEGRLWGTMMGPFGGCYALRRTYFSPVPSNFLVDDFYINMKVLEKGGRCINEPSARVYEDVSNNLKEEFRRKVRIATGNYQNLSTFFHLLLRFNATAFCFFSHKVLRWWGPFLMIIAFSCAAALTHFPNIYSWFLLLSLVVLVLPLCDYLLKATGTHVKLLRFITHFLSMNLALLIGLFKYLGGVRSSVWEPTKRNQK